MADPDELDVQDSRSEIAASRQHERLRTHQRTRLPMVPGPGPSSENEYDLATTLSTLDLDDASSEALEVQDGRSEIAASYQYEPLPTRGHTRVLILEPDPNDENEMPLAGSLKLLDLGDENSEPFEAISYVWGSSEMTHNILVDGHPMPITANLWEALRQTRPYHLARRLWADAICINQSDDTEKGHQVAAMGRIYKKSKSTLICLGVQNPEHARQAAGLVDEVNLMIQNIQRDPNFSGEPESFPFPAENDTIVSDPRWELGWGVMLSQPWFDRGWVVQEASLGPEACVLWASMQIDWTSILRVACWLDRRGLVDLQSQGRERPHGLVAHHYCSFARRHPEEASLFDKNPLNKMWTSTLGTLVDMRDVDLLDPRDRIYAFMALETSDGILAGLQLDPDYTRSFLEIYHEFALKYIEMTGNLDILSYTKHSKKSIASPAMSEAIPSWVPRWDLALSLRPPIITEMGGHPKFFTFTEKYSILQVRGLILGSVEYSAAQQPYCQYKQRSLALQNVISLWKEVVAASSMNGEPYNGRQAFAFFDVLCPFHYIDHSATWRQEFVRYLQSYRPGPERNSTISVSQRRVITTEQHSVKIMAEEIRHGGPRRFVILSRGYYGIAPPITQRGDLFALIYGNKTLSILRPVKGKPLYYQILGPVYVESKTVKNPYQSNKMGREGCRDWEEWGLEEQDISLC